MGHDVLTSYEANQGIPDDDVLCFAHQQKRIVLTLNRKDFIELHNRGQEHSGIILCKDDRNYNAQALTVHELIVNTGDFQGRIFRVQKSNIKGSPDQVFIYNEL